MAALPTAQVPIGTIISYVGTDYNMQQLAEHGWLLCDGSPVTTDDFPELFDVIRTAFGGEGSPSFNLPDLRGAFMRGVDQGAGKDPDTALRGPQAANGNTGDAVGSVQGDQLRNHMHNWANNFKYISTSGNDIAIQLADANQAQYSAPTTNTDGGGNETRPFNVYVYYMILGKIVKAS
jgi:microcystin-dependent protein